MSKLTFVRRCRPRPCDRVASGRALALAIAVAACGDDPSERIAVPDAGPELPRDAAPPPHGDAGGPPPAPVARLCSSAGWCWDGPGIQTNSLNAIAASAPSDVWVAGELGTVLHFDGATWSSRRAPTEHDLHALWAFGAEVWVAGDGATLLRYDGQSWHSEDVSELAPGSSLHGVFGDGAGTLWVVGSGGTLLERRAGEWSRVVLDTTRDLNAVWSDGSRVWVVGDAGTVLRFQGGSWAPVDVETSRDLTTIHGREQQVWLGGVAGEVRYWDEEALRWQRATGEGPAPSGDVRAVYVTRAGQVYAATGSGRVHVFDTTATCPVAGDAGAPEQPCPDWVEARGSGSDLPLSGVWASGDSVLAVGPHGAMVSWDGALREVLSPGTLDNYLDVAGASADEVWAAGDRLVRRGGGRWQDVERDSPRAVYALAALGPGRALIAGTGGMARGYADSTWQSMDVDADAWLRGIWSDGDTGWLVGSRGGAWGLLNNRLWTPLPTPTQSDLMDVWVAPGGNAWAVGAGGVILRHDGQAWAAIPSGPDDGVGVELRGVWGSADDDIWAVGSGGTVLHWDGARWTRVGAAAAFSLNDIWGQRADDVWAVGTGGVILHYDGASWQPEASGTGHALNAVWGSGDRLWTVGEHGTILMKQLEAGE